MPRQKKALTKQKKEKILYTESEQQGLMLHLISKRVNITESYVSLVLGIVVVIVLLSLIFAFARGRKVLNPSDMVKNVTPEIKKQDNAKNTPTPTPQKDLTGAITGDSYTVTQGELLWDIAARAYGDGNRWADIAKANNLVNPDSIPGGTVLKIPR